MKIAVGSDHAGFPLKKEIVEHLLKEGYEVIDKGTESPESVDYPDYAESVCKAVTGGEAERGILVCGTGIGMTMAANKVPGIRAANCSSEYTAEMSRRHNDANILALGGRVVTPDMAKRIVEVWLKAEFEGGRHALRLKKLTSLEEAGR